MELFPSCWCLHSFQLKKMLFLALAFAFFAFFGSFGVGSYKSRKWFWCWAHCCLVVWAPAWWLASLQGADSLSSHTYLWRWCFLLLEWNMWVVENSFFIGPESDHWQCLSVTDSLTNSLLFSKLDWCDPGVWRCQLKTCCCCNCCWWGSCWQQFAADFEAEVWSKS